MGKTTLPLILLDWQVECSDSKEMQKPKALVQLAAIVHDSHCFSCFSLQTSAFSAFGIGQALVAAGYVLYSCSTELVFTLGRSAGCREFEIHGGRIKAQTKTQITQNTQKEGGKMKIRQHWLVLRKRFLCSIAIVPSCCQAFLNHYNLL